MKKKTPEDIIIPQMMIRWCMVPETWSATIRIFCHFGLFFALLLPNNPENQNFEKMKKMLVDIIILHKCTINENHTMYVSWDMDCDRYIFFSFLTIFCPIEDCTGAEEAGVELASKVDRILYTMKWGEVD